MLKFAATLLLALVAAAARASDHEPVLDKTRQGEIAPFNSILSAARSVIGNRMMLLDARFHVEESDPYVDIYFYRRLGNRVITVTVDAVNVEVVNVIGQSRNDFESWPDRGEAANSRPNAESKSAAGPDPADGVENGGKDAGSDGKDGQDSGKNDGGKGSGSGGDGGKGGGSGNDGGKGGSSGGDGGKDGGSGNGGGKGGSGK